MTRTAAAGVVMRKARVVEQAIAERCLPRILDQRTRDRRDRLLVGAWLRRRRLRNRGAGGAKAHDDEDHARYIAARSGRDARQSQAMARVRHGQFTIVPREPANVTPKLVPNCWPPSVAQLSRLSPSHSGSPNSQPAATRWPRSPPNLSSLAMHERNRGKARLDRKTQRFTSSEPRCEASRLEG